MELPLPDSVDFRLDLLSLYCCCVDSVLWIGLVLPSCLLAKKRLKGMKTKPFETSMVVFVRVGLGHVTR